MENQSFHSEKNDNIYAYNINFCQQKQLVSFSALTPSVGDIQLTEAEVRK